MKITNIIIPILYCILYILNVSNNRYMFLKRNILAQFGILKCNRKKIYLWYRAAF